MWFRQFGGLGCIERAILWIGHPLVWLVLRWMTENSNYGECLRCRLKRQNLLFVIINTFM